MNQTDGTWALEALKRAIQKTNFHAAVQDVRKFLGPALVPGLAYWNVEYFMENILAYEAALAGAKRSKL